MSSPVPVPIHQLPTELLCSILEVAASNDRATLAAVRLCCSQWNIIAVALASLWTRVTLADRKAGDRTIVASVLERSLILPIHLTLDFRRGMPPSIVHTGHALEILRPHIHRVESFTLRARHADFEPVVARLQLPGFQSQFLTLRSLCLEVSRSHARGLPGLRTLFPLPPGLATLEQVRLIGPVAIPPIQLASSPDSTISIGRDARVLLTDVAFGTGISASPPDGPMFELNPWLLHSGANHLVLDDLAIPRIRHYPMYPPPLETRRVSSIKTLELSRLRDPSDINNVDAWPVFDSLYTPQLTSLRIDSMSLAGMILGDFLSVFDEHPRSDAQTRYPVLEHFALINTPFESDWEPAFEGLFRHMPRLTRLTMRDCEDEASRHARR